MSSGSVSTVDSSIEKAKYISLRTYRKDGSSVDTPVWFALLDGKIVVFTDGTSYKVKRIRNNAAVQLASCDARGKQIFGPWLDGRCRPVESEPELIKRGYQALNTKYGWMMRIGTVLSTLSGRVGRRLILEINLSSPAVAAQ